jgi:hypothetical protein
MGCVDCPLSENRTRRPNSCRGRTQSVTRLKATKPSRHHILADRLAKSETLARFAGMRFSFRPRVFYLSGFRYRSLAVDELPARVKPCFSKSDRPESCQQLARPSSRLGTANFASQRRQKVGRFRCWTWLVNTQWPQMQSLPGWYNYFY